MDRFFSAARVGNSRFNDRLLPFVFLSDHSGPRFHCSNRLQNFLAIFRIFHPRRKSANDALVHVRHLLAVFCSMVCVDEVHMFFIVEIERFSAARGLQPERQQEVPILFVACVQNIVIPVFGQAAVSAREPSRQE